MWKKYKPVPKNYKTEYDWCKLWKTTASVFETHGFLECLKTEDPAEGLIQYFKL